MARPGEWVSSDTAERRRTGMRATREMLRRAAARLSSRGAKKGDVAISGIAGIASDEQPRRGARAPRSSQRHLRALPRNIDVLQRHVQQRRARLVADRG